MVRVLSPAFVFLLLTTVVAVIRSSSLVRKRREWILPPRPLRENYDYTQKEYIAKIRSDNEEHSNINYALEGKGVDEAPFNVFVVDSKTGYIRVTKILDREEVAFYNLSGIATFLDGSHAETKIDIRIKVVDENDNSPIFPTVFLPGEVFERSPMGTKVMDVIATDLDEPGNINSQIFYSIVKQDPPNDMFFIKPNGTLYVKKNSLDRETVDRYILTIKGTDLNGDVRGNTGLGTVTVNIKDINDNLPTLQQTQYKASIKENTHGVEVMRFKADDLDLVGTENWMVEFIIAKGNEAGYFSITTDPKTNEGILMLDKAVDYEDVKNLNLGIILKNKAPMFDGSEGSSMIGVDVAGGSSGTLGTGGTAGTGGTGGASGASGGSGSIGSSFETYTVYTVNVTVENEPEGARFDPKVKVITISEGGTTINLKDVITRYPAIDQDTGKPATNVKYVKGTDPGNWLIIDPVTAEVKLNKLPDRESPLLVNGTYYAEVLCISEDMPAKTSTGTIAIQVEDFNDHCPTLTSTVQIACLPEDAVVVSAEDGDPFPNGAPFTYTIIPENTKGKWQVQYLNDTARILRSEETLWPGLYEVELIVTDQQGEACPEPQRVLVQVCSCEDGVKCGKRDGTGQPEKDVTFGPGGIGLMFLGLFLLLLIPLLALFCLCGGYGFGGVPSAFTEMPYDTKSHLINYHTEGQGDNTDVPLMNMQTTHVDGSKYNMSMGGTHMSNMEVQQHSGMSREFMNGYYGEEGTWREMNHREGTWRNQMGGSGFQSEFMSREREAGLFDGMGLPYHYLGQYYNQKMQGSEVQAGKDHLLVYDYEGQGSIAGSLGSLDDLGLDNDLCFLDDLDPKFKTLAEVCGGKIHAEVKAPAPPTTSISSNTLVTKVKAPAPPTTSISSNTVVTKVMAPGPLPRPVPTPLPAPKAEVKAEVKTEVISSKLQESSERSQIVTVKEVVQEAPRVPAPQAPQGQMVFLQQQPQLYYTTAPVMQPMQYMVQAPGPNIQSVMLVNGPQGTPAQGLVMQGQTLVRGQTLVQGQAVGQPGMVLVEKAQGPGASVSGSPTMVLVEGKGQSGSTHVLKSGQNLVQPGLSGSHTLMVVGSNSAQGQQPWALSSDLSGSQKVMVESGAKNSLSGGQSGSLSAFSKTSSSSSRDIKGSSTPSSSRRVVVQETREVIQTNM